MDEKRPPYRHIACLVDRTRPDSTGAVLSLGESVRGHGDALISVVHVAPARASLESGLSEWGLDPEDPLRPVRAWVEEVCHRCDGARPVVLQGPDPAGAVAEWAATEAVDVLVAAGASAPARHVVLGSFTSALAGISTVPLLLSPPRRTPEPSTTGGQLELRPQAAFSRIVCCVDDSPAASAAVEEAMRLASASGGSVVLARAVMPPRPFRLRRLTRMLPAPRRQVAVARGRLADRAARANAAKTVLMIGTPADVAEWAARHDADLVVAGTRADHLAPRVLGSFARRLALEATLPVLLVPPAEVTEADMEVDA